MAPWRFYVYAFFDHDRWAYVGKGSGRRLSAQSAKIKLQGCEIARFRSEKQAYCFERELIAANAPYLNKHPGGNGNRAMPARIERGWPEIDAVGSRAYSARLVLAVLGIAPHLVNISEIDELRRVAYGCGA